jgi:hypothetical protein
MAYTLNYSLGTITVQDTTINTQTSISLPGRNYAGYGAPVDQNQLSILENWASYANGGPANPIPGQTWYSTANSSFFINTSSNSTAQWTQILSASSANANVTFGNISTGNLTVTGTANLGTTLTRVITTGANTTTGTITGAWTLTTGSTLNATYADLAERFEADAEYDEGTVMELGGVKEITAVREDASETILGVVSRVAGMVLNSAAGTDETHPKIAMAGRVPVKVVGTVTKGDRLVSAGAGIARAAKQGEATAFNTIGRSLEDKLTAEQGKVLAAVSAKL